MSSRQQDADIVGPRPPYRSYRNQRYPAIQYGTRIKGWIRDRYWGGTDDYWCPSAGKEVSCKSMMMMKGGDCGDCGDCGDSDDCNYSVE